MKKAKKLGFIMLTALVMGNMIGSGVFLLPSTLAPYGYFALAGWVVSAIGAMLLAFIFARLSFHIPLQGGIYAFSRHVFGDYIGFQVAWGYWVQTWVGNAAIIVGIMAYLASIWPALMYNKILAIIVSQGVLWTITGINLMSLRTAGIVQTVTTILKLIPILLIAIVGLFYVDVSNLTVEPIDTAISPWDAMNKVVLLTMWSFIGVETAGVPAGSIKNPRKIIPLATLVGTGITAIIYLISMVVIMGVVPQGDLALSTAPYALAAQNIFGSYWGTFFFWVVAIGAIISSLGALNGWILIQGQMPLAAAENNLFPKIFKKKNKTGVPYIGILVSSGLISLLLLFGIQEGFINLFEFIISLATLAILICYLFAVSAQIAMMHTGEISLKDISWVDRVLAPLAFIYVIYAMYGAGNLMSVVALFFFASTPIYAFVAKRKNNSQKT